MTETERGAPKPTEEVRDRAGVKGDAVAKDPKLSSADRDRGDGPAADGDCAIDLDSAHDRAS